jgi:hypothetical protein
MELDENSKYWERIRKNIKKLYKDGKIEERYSFESFCNDFTPEDEPLENKETDKCICDHDIIHNYEYKHKDNTDYFILGSCCIKKFSTVYKQQRECEDCGNKIRKDKKRCNDCKIKEFRRKEKEEKCKCIKCGYIMKDDKYSKCYKCKYGTKEIKYNKCKECGMNKKEDTFFKCYKCNMKNKYNPIEDNIRVATDSWTD